MKLYIAGPMTGLPQLNYPAFEQVAKNLRAMGYDVISPNEYNIDDWDTAMRPALHALIDAEGVAVLQNWEFSRGARLEVHIAIELGIPVKCWQEWVNDYDAKTR